MTSTLAAIRLGGHAISMKIARRKSSAGLHTLVDERSAMLLPGSEAGSTGSIIQTLQRYAATCRRHRATISAVATASFWERRGTAQLLSDIREQAGLSVEVVSGPREAQLICKAALQGTPTSARTIVVDVHGHSTSVVLAAGDRPVALCRIGLGAASMSDQFSPAMVAEQAEAVERFRHKVAEQLRQARVTSCRPSARAALAVSSTACRLIHFASLGSYWAKRQEIKDAIAALVALGLSRRQEILDPWYAETLLPCGAIVDALMDALNLDSIMASPHGLREGVLMDQLTAEKLVRSAPSG